MREKKLDVTVPRGVDDGMQLRLGGEGEPGAMGGPPGDLYVFIRVKSHDVFERHGNDIACAADIPFPVAALGGQIEVPTLEGTASLDVPQGAQHGDLLRLAGLGVPDVRSGQRGDQLVQVRLRVPKSLNDRQRELLRELGEIEGAKIKAAGESSMKRFFSKLVGDD
jgi:molecular chaperone DnaJ